ncbi:VOC family protein [Alkalihalobacillus sp. AL-G]|uniref:VOC family protein n=1 Tax=Alkalihalobacillus sp. AL-G TaxID=2926399 RepID=UPI00272B2BE4|nr:VOC family protein [Alkalihalobacillus sp. AL-G]WLD92454.1 VOC family protein [Alkalihalobacillus sp. AL-G]
MYKRVHHVSLEIKELGRARAFYENLLGLTVSPQRPDFDFEGVWYQIGDTQLHLIVNDSANVDTKPTLNSRSAHFAIRVTAIAELIERFENQGIPYLNKPASKTGWHQVFVQDPDGNIIEFNA